MKKNLSILTVMAIFVLMFVFVSSAKAEDLDSTCTANSSGWISATRTGGLTQYFKPVLTHLTKMQLVLSDQSAGIYRISLKKADNTTLTSQEFTGSGGGSQIYKVFDGFDVEVTPGDWYKILLERVTGSIGWHYTNDANCYANGYAYWDGTAQSKDTWFYTWGYTPSSTPTTSSTTTTTSSESTTTTTASSESESASTTTTVSSADIDKSITKPALSYIEKNGEKTPAPIDQEIVVTKKDKLKIAGVSFSGVKEINIFVGEKEFSAQVDKDGNWTVEPKLAEFKDGSYTVSAQAKNNKDKYSEKTDLFKLKKENAKVSPVSVNVSQNQSFWQKLFTEYVYYSTVILILVLASVAIAVYYLIKKKKQEVK